VKQSDISLSKRALHMYSMHYDIYVVKV